ncbi:MAG: Modification methylase DpnIIA [Stenotrophomonas rhizophila]|nr:Modification methylase DpnIIA [Stenotrophomonas rhizophila]
MDSDGGEERRLLPFLKWAGGKRWLMNLAKEIREEGVGTYYEPFVGSGAMFFAINPKAAILNDSNADLMDAYRALKADHGSVVRLLRRHHRQHSTEYYYAVRASAPRSSHGRAARFIYLNRTCWNGLYRVNRNGDFNVPKGTKTKVLLDTDNFALVSSRLSGVTLCNGDFECVIARAGAGDFVFADPPYTVRHQYNGFIKYNEKLFTWDDQVRLRDCLLAAANRGARVVCTNADHHSIRELYGSGFELHGVSRYSAIAGSTKFRGKYAELIIRA